MAAPKLSDLPDIETESSLYNLVDELQRLIASAAVDEAVELRAVPDWTVQLLVFWLAQYHETSKITPAHFSSFARSLADAGSSLFQDTNIWPAKDEPLDNIKKLLDNTCQSQVCLIVLIGHALDHGRTLIWDYENSIFSRERNLTTAKVQGVFYTPAFIARHLVERCLPSKTGKSPPLVCDPAVGGGIFLVAAALRLLENYEAASIRDSLFGADTDPIAVEVTSIVLDSLLGIWRPGTIPETVTQNIVVGDAFGGPARGGSRTPLPGGIDWQKSFRSIFANQDGFDCVLINPPFGRYKVNADWLIAKEMRLDPQSLQSMKTTGKSRSDSLRRSGWYELATLGVIDKSRLGLERAMQLTAPGGSLGAVLPSTIAADAQSVKLRRYLLSEWRVEELNEFPESARLFNDVNMSTVVMVAKNLSHSDTIRVRADLHDEDDLRQEPRGECSFSLLRTLSSKWAIPVRSAESSELLESMHRHPRLSDYSHIRNARGEVDLTIYSEALTNNPDERPLIRGDQLDAYQADLPSEKKRFIESQALLEGLQRSPKLADVERPRIVGRQCSYLFRPQRLSFASIQPGSAVANSCNYIVCEDEDFLLYLLAMLNSGVVNWRFNATSSNNHVANSELDDLPIPNPASLPKSTYSEIVAGARALVMEYCPKRHKELDVLIAVTYGVPEDVMMSSGMDIRR